MKSEKLQDAIGEIKDEYINEAHADKAGKKRILWIKILAVAACVCLCSLGAIPALAAMDNKFAYDVLYNISPAIAQKLKPVNMSCEDKGIELKVISASVEGDTVDVLVSIRDLTGARLDETTDLYDSYSIHTPFDSVGTCNLVEYNDETKTAVFLVEISHMKKVPVTGDKITFSVNHLLSKKSHTKMEITQIDMTNLKEAKETLSNVHIEGYARGCLEDGMPADNDPVKVIKPRQESALTVIDGVKITGYGIVDGKLHVQVLYENNLENDNHGEIYIKDKNEEYGSSERVWFWDEIRKISYEEIIFNVPAEDLENYKMFGHFESYGASIRGNWEVTFPITAE